MNSEFFNLKNSLRDIYINQQIVVLLFDKLLIYILKLNSQNYRLNFKGITGRSPNRNGSFQLVIIIRNKKILCYLLLFIIFSFICV